MKNKFSDPAKDIYLYGRFCDYFWQSKEITESRRKRESYKKLAKHYGFPQKMIYLLRQRVAERRIAVHGGSYPLP